MSINTIYLDDIIGTLGFWLSADNYEVPIEVIKLLQQAYKTAVKALEDESETEVTNTTESVF